MMTPVHVEDSSSALLLMVWILSVYIFLLMFFIGYCYLVLRRTLRKESKSMAFSALTIQELERERLRIVQELHDSVLPHIADQELSARIRSTIRNLSPPDFTRLGLKDSLAGLCLDFTKRAGIACVCLMEEDLHFSPLSPERQLHLYRIAQEALYNIEKHANAAKASVMVRRLGKGNDARILLCVADDGQGIKDAEGRVGEDYFGARFGLNSMRQRAIILGTRLEIINERGNGLMIRVEAPLYHPELSP